MKSSSATFSFANYVGTRNDEGVPSKWICFNGVFSITMNETMFKLLIETIDAGSDPDGSLDDPVFDLVTEMEGVNIQEYSAHTSLFLITCLDNIYCIQCRLDGLITLRDALELGANYEDEQLGSSLYAFVQQANTCISVWQRVIGQKDLPQGYIPAEDGAPRRRKRRSDTE